MRCVEDVVVFRSTSCSYYPQGVVRLSSPVLRNRKGKRGDVISKGGLCGKEYFQEFTGYPHNVIEIHSENTTEHPTQKPVALMEYLIKTYTLEGETVLDFTCGSGTTGVACKQTGREFIGIEQDPEYFKLAEERIKAAVQQYELF